MRNTSADRIDPHRQTESLILGAVADGTVLVGTVETLAHSLNVRGAELRSILRGLLEAEKIAVTAEVRGQLTIRRERRRADALPNLPPSPERRRSASNLRLI